MFEVEQKCRPNESDHWMVRQAKLTTGRYPQIAQIAQIPQMTSSVPEIEKSFSQSGKGAAKTEANGLNAYRPRLDW
jgi:hypothetical protein